MTNFAKKFLQTTIPMWWTIASRRPFKPVGLDEYMRQACAFACIGFLGLQGCDRREAVLPAEQLGRPLIIRHGDPVPKPGPAPKITIESIYPNTHVRINEQIVCTVRVNIPEGGRMPQVVLLYFRSDHGERWSPTGPAIPEVREDRSALLKSRMNAPSRPGTYVLDAESMTHTIYQPKSSRDTETVETTRALSEGIKLYVVK